MPLELGRMKRRASPGFLCPFAIPLKSAFGHELSIVLIWLFNHISKTAKGTDISEVILDTYIN
jgi:hypothetical protein